MDTESHRNQLVQALGLRVGGGGLGRRWQMADISGGQNVPVLHRPVHANLGQLRKIFEYLISPGNSTPGTEIRRRRLQALRRKRPFSMRNWALDCWPETSGKLSSTSIERRGFGVAAEGLGSFGCLGGGGTARGRRADGLDNGGRRLAGGCIESVDGTGKVL